MSPVYRVNGISQLAYLRNFDDQYRDVASHAYVPLHSVGDTAHFSNPVLAVLPSLHAVTILRLTRYLRRPICTLEPIIVRIYSTVNHFFQLSFQLDKLLP